MKKLLTFAILAVVAISATACGGCGWPQKCCDDSCEESCNGGTCDTTSNYPTHG